MPSKAVRYMRHINLISEHADWEMDGNLRWFKALLLLFITLLVESIIFLKYNSFLLCLLVLILLLAGYLIFSYIEVRLKNRKFKVFIDRSARHIAPPKSMEFASGYLFFDDEALIFYICPLESGLYFYKSMYCSSYIRWEDIRHISILEGGKEISAKVVVGSGKGDKKEIVVPWSNDFNSVVNSKTWLISP